MRTIGTPSTQARKLSAIASGALPNGKAVIVNSDGTVSQVTETSVTQATGSATTFEESTSYARVEMGYDSANEKIVIIYEDIPDSEKGYAIVGTVSGTSISFGTPVQFSTAAFDGGSVSFDSTASKVVISYTDKNNSNYGTAIVGTVSGTSISFGTAVVFNSASTAFIYGAYDSNANKTVIGYRDNANAYRGTAIVGTVSGTSISFGSEVVFNSGTSNDIRIVYHEADQKLVFCYKDSSASSRGTCTVGTVSGTSISFGGEYQFETGSTSYLQSAYDSLNEQILLCYTDVTDANIQKAVVANLTGTAISYGAIVEFDNTIVGQGKKILFDPAANKFSIFYRDSTNDIGRIVIGTLAGDVITFDTPFTVITNEANAIFGAYDSANNVNVYAYIDVTESFKVKAFIFRNSYSASNISADAFVGISEGGSVADGQSATIGVIGSIVSNQSGLTAGKKYYVQSDGSFSTTPDSPSVFAGTAVSATKMVVKS